jgi:hypothetical protein
MIFELDVVHNLPTKLPQKSWMKNCLPLSSRPVYCHSWPLNGIGGICGLTPKGLGTIFKPFLKFGQAIVKAIVIKNS